MVYSKESATIEQITAEVRYTYNLLQVQYVSSRVGWCLMIGWGIKILAQCLPPLRCWIINYSGHTHDKSTFLYKEEKYKFKSIREFSNLWVLLVTKE